MSIENSLNQEKQRILMQIFSLSKMVTKEDCSSRIFINYSDVSKLNLSILKKIRAEYKRELFLLQWAKGKSLANLLEQRQCEDLKLRRILFRGGCVKQTDDMKNIIINRILFLDKFIKKINCI